MRILLLLLSTVLAPTFADRPNIVILVADDLGIGDLGCFGNTTLTTPNIDRLAEEGAKLTQHLTASAVCTPSRAALLTSRLPIRMGMESGGRNKVFLMVASSGGLPSNETTFVKTLQKSGYATALLGKWHLGLYCDSKSDPCHHPLNHGFDYFYGIPLTNLRDFGDEGDSVVTAYYPHLNITIFIFTTIAFVISLYLVRRGWLLVGALITVGFIFNPLLFLIFLRSIATLNGVVMRNLQVVEQPIQLPGMTQRLVAEAESFLDQRVELDDEKPFLLWINFLHVHTALFTAPNFVGASINHGAYGDNVIELDWAVGRIMDALLERGFDKNTIVYFTSDNGAHITEYSAKGVREGGCNGIYRGGKTMGGWEGGIRVPTIIRWPDVVKPQSVIDTATSQMDVGVTLLAAAKATPPKADVLLDGRDMTSLLRSADSQHPAPIHEFMFHYCGIWLFAVRYSPKDEPGRVYKVHYRTTVEENCAFVCQCFGSSVMIHDPPLVYDITIDPSEQSPLEYDKAKPIIELADVAVKAHNTTLSKVPNQFSFINSMWIPWLQPCCRLPFCSCTDDKTPRAIVGLRDEL